MKPLIAITRPRDISEFLEAVDKIKGYDKLWINYYKQYEAYRKIKEWFMFDERYNRLALLADDLIIKQEHIDRLDELSNDYDVVCGICNVDNGFYQDFLNICMTLPSKQAFGRTYAWMSERAINEDKLTKPVRIAHAGTPLMILNRHVVEMLSFEGDYKYNNWPEELSSAHDVIMCHELNDLGIPLMCDTNVRMKHLKITDGIDPRSQVGKKIPNVRWVRAS